MSMVLCLGLPLLLPQDTSLSLRTAFIFIGLGKNRQKINFILCNHVYKYATADKDLLRHSELRLEYELGSGSYSFHCRYDI